MEGMLDNLSQPVAFTTAPLGMETDAQGKRGLRRDGSSSSDTDRDDSLSTKLSRKLGLDSMSSEKIQAASVRRRTDLPSQNKKSCLRKRKKRSWLTEVRFKLCGLGNDSESGGR